MTSRLDYCNALHGGCPASSINKLQIVQNAAARVLTRSRKYDHITPMLQSLHWLPIKFRISYKILLLAYKCHGPAGVPRLATRCLCVLSTWLVVCLVPCAPMSIVCPLPSCYLIIVSVAPAVSPSLPSFVSLYSSPCVCSLVLIRCLSCVHVM